MMETARNEALPEGVEANPAATADESGRAVSQNTQSQAQQAQVAQAESPPASPAPESGRTAAAASAQPDEDAGRGSVLEQFLADGPPQLEEGRDGAPADRRPVEMGQEDAEPGAEEAPLETAADDAPVSGGVSVYRDFDGRDFGGVDGDLAPDLAPTTLPADLAGDTIDLEGADPIFVEQFGEPLVLSSLAAGAPMENVVVPPAAPAPSEPESELDPLTERRLAAGEDLDGGGAPPPDDGDNIAGTDASEALNGGAGDDAIDGGAGDDTLDGGAGDDTLTGGDGQDVFAFSTTDDDGNDVVTDFGTGSDTLRLSDVTDVNTDGAVDLGDLDADPANTVTGDAGNVNIGLAGGTTVTLSGVDGTGVDTFAELTGNGVNVDVA